MKKVAVFGKPGSGKSTLSKELALSTGIPLCQFDSIVFKQNGEHCARDVIDAKHQEILSSDSWIIDGMGPLALFNARLQAADTLIYIDLPYHVSYWLVTKRLLKGLAIKPEGWPKGSSVINGTINSYKTLRRCPQFWNDEFRKNIEELSSNKTLYVISSLSELNGFIHHI